MAQQNPRTVARPRRVVAGLDPRRLKAGSSEIRNWIVVAGAFSVWSATS
jgi:hypothetical protein